MSLSVGICPQVRAQDRPAAEIDFEMQERQLELMQLEADVEFANRMRELELESRRVEIDLMRDANTPVNGDGQGAIFLLCLVVNILMAVWVYSDNRRRDAGYGIWIVITLLAGFFGALVYALIRLGDMRTPPPAPGRSAAVKK